MTSIPEFTLLPYYLSGIVPYVTLCGSAYLAWRLVRAYERRGVATERLRALAGRVQALEAAIETVEEQVRRTAEAQRFTTALLSGHAAGADRQAASGAAGNPPRAA